MKLELFTATFITIFLAELGDKTQFAAMAAAAQSKSTMTILIATLMALGFAATIGVLAGSFLGSYVDPQTMKYVSGGCFIAMGIWTLLR